MKNPVWFLQPSELRFSIKLIQCDILVQFEKENVMPADDHCKSNKLSKFICQSSLAKVNGPSESLPPRASAADQGQVESCHIFEEFSMFVPFMLIFS